VLLYFGPSVADLGALPGALIGEAEAIGFVFDGNCHFGSFGYVDFLFVSS
jgi:hypothetical protein